MNPPETLTETLTGAQPDVQMLAVLETLNTLGGQPVETLSPSDARQQPTPADAVREMLMHRGQATIEFGVRQSCGLAATNPH